MGNKRNISVFRNIQFNFPPIRPNAAIILGAINCPNGFGPFNTLGTESKHVFVFGIKHD